MKRVITGIITAALLTLLASNGTAEAKRPKPQPSPTVTVTVNKTAVFGKSNYAAGVNHEHDSFDAWGDPTAVQSGKTRLAAGNLGQSQAIMGWGANNPEPSPGVYDWGSLDARVQLMRDTSASPKVITLCCSPTWMLPGGVSGTTDWSRLETWPDVSHYDDFAALAATVAQRYPDVTDFNFWNEMKGLYRADVNRWNYEEYTVLYNKVYDAVKAVRSDARIGGPYVVMDSWGGPQSNPSNVYGSWGRLDQRALDVITYWLANKHGADFLVIDAANNNKDNIWLTDGYGACEKFSAIMSWIRTVEPSLPVRFAEWYAWFGASSPSLTASASVMATCHAQMVRLGTNESYQWAAQGDVNGAAFPVALVTDTRVSGGGQATVYYPIHKGLKDYFGSNVTLYHVSSSSSNVDALASATKVMLTNKTSGTITVIVDGAYTVTLSPYQVAFTNA
jgi:hypothetical protein